MPSGPDQCAKEQYCAAPVEQSGRAVFIPINRYQGVIFPSDMSMIIRVARYKRGTMVGICT
ncbi:MAG: hypothetical protein ACREXO_10160, partial [Advenella sp.]